MKRILLLFLMLAVTRRAEACFNVYLPDLAPPAGQQVAAITTTFPVPASTTSLFYPFNVTLDNAGTLTVTQTVGDPSKMLRTYTGVTRASLVSWMSFFYPTQWTGGFEYAPDRTGVYRKIQDSMILLGYETMGLQPPGQELTWLFRSDWRVAQGAMNAAMSTPLNPGTSWNVGIWAPYGMQALGLQIKLQVCP